MKAVAASILLLALLVSARPADAVNYTEDAIVVLGPEADPSTVAAQHAQQHGFVVNHVYRHALQGYAARLQPSQVTAISKRPEVRYVVRGAGGAAPVPKAAVTEEPPQRVNGWNKRVGGPDSSAASGDGQGAVDIGVAVLDGGIQPDHPDLNVVGGFNCLAGEPTDDWDDSEVDGHGTMVAGIIGAKDNDIGIVGIVPGARLYAVRVVRASDGYITDPDLLCGLDWVVGTRTDDDPTNDISVVNMSLGGHYRSATPCGPTTRDPVHVAVCALVDVGVTSVAAAGNEASTISNRGPANFPEVLTAAGMADNDVGLPGGLGPASACFKNQRDDTYAFFSNFATRTVDHGHVVAAPAVCMTSTFPGSQYAFNSGTSFATPIVSGVVALCIASGHCPPSAPATTMATIVRDAAAHNRANPGYGFVGDPLRQNGSKYFGYLVYAGLY